jgi:Tol biopolymer transport system component
MVLVLSCGAWGQYFGRNKVQYEVFDFLQLKSAHFTLLYYPELEPVINDHAAMLERWYLRHSALFNRNLSALQPVVLYADHADFQQTNIIGGLIPQGVGGVTEGIANRMVIPLTGVYQENDHVLGHELVHAFHYDILRSSSRGVTAAAEMPLWFIEGMAEYLTLGQQSPQTASWMRDAVLHDDLPSIRALASKPEYFPYRFGHALWAYIGGQWGDEVVARLYDGVIEFGLSQGIQRVLGISLDSLSQRWQQATVQTFAPQLVGRMAAGQLGTALVSTTAGYNLSPSLSPDGSRIAFLSQQGLFGIGLFVADGTRGNNVRQLAFAESDDHYDALRFVNASGAWSPDGTQFAYIVVAKGDNAIAFFDVEHATLLRTVTIDAVDALLHLAWSPDGGTMLFSGVKGGVSDLYAYTIENGSVRQLTHDRHGDIMPAWSADGKSIVFCTDRPATEGDSHHCGSMRIGFMELSSTKLTTYSIAEGVSHISPQFGPNGEDIFFVADAGGINDIYRYHRSTQQLFRISKVATAVCGLSDLSPTLSLARTTARAACSVFERRGYNIYRLDSTQLYGEEILSVELTRQSAALLPPGDTLNNSSFVNNYLNTLPPGPLAAPSLSVVAPYNAQLQLLALGNLALGVSADRYGSTLGGGVSMLFGDMLGNHLLGVSAQISGSIRDIGAQAVYMNRRYRFNVGGALSHIPYLSYSAQLERDSIAVDSGKVFVDRVDETLDRVFVERIAGGGVYPLSPNRRVELAGGYSRYWHQVQGRSFFINSDDVVMQEAAFEPAKPVALNLFHGSIAYVGDHSHFGLTDPIKGRRYRLEVEPTVGTLLYANVLADYRYYLFFRPLTLALRGLHYGRYLRDAEDEQLSLLHIGYPTLVRGYMPSHYSARECDGDVNNGDCPRFDRLFGSRIAVANTELRLPLLGTKDFGLVSFRYLPTTLVAFFDGGVAWTQQDGPQLKWSRSSLERIPVFSGGVGLRFNLFGMAIVELDWAYPFQRPDGGGQWALFLAPGF